MQNYQKLYTLLFNACTDVVEAMERMDFGMAKTILVSAQQQAEECYIAAEASAAAEQPAEI